MKKTGSFHYGRAFGDRRRLFPFFVSLLVSVTLFLATVFGLFSSPSGGGSVFFDIISFTSFDVSDGYSVETDYKTSFDPELEAPRIAYLITGNKGDSQRMIRTLQAIYHPRNHYILHLDLEAPPQEQIELAMYVKDDPVFNEVKNVRVIAKPNLVTYMGPTAVSCTLHAIAILLKEGVKWDWFVNLSAEDYPLMTQDDILHVFSSLPRDLNFIQNTRNSGWRVNERAKPIIVDPSLYSSKKFDIFWTTERRELPTFELFTGSAWMIATRDFLEYCIWGWDNLPRTVLMYYVNSVSSSEGYFSTVICNSDDFRNSTISHDLHYIAWDNPPKQHPLSLSIKDFDKMVQSGAPFARKFAMDDPVLDKIDRELLGRSDGQFTPGAWCVGRSDIGIDPCSTRGDDFVFLPSPGSKRLRELLQKLLSQDSRNKSCSTQSSDEIITM